MAWDNDQWDSMHGLGLYGLGMGFFFLLLLGLAIWATIRITRSDTKSDKSVPPATKASIGETPKEILDRRFANGEISAEDYQRAKELLAQ